MSEDSCAVLSALDRLHELRDEPRRRQVGYAVRLFVRTVGLRRALRSAAAPVRARDW